MIDYDATLQMFFVENIKYLEKMKSKAQDKVYATRIMAAIDVVQRIAANPAKFADYNARVKEGMEDFDICNAFIRPGTNDNSAWLSFSAVINSMGDLNNRFDYKREQAQKKLLVALKSIKYKNSTNMLKDFVFSFKSPKSFAIESTKQYEI
ncbi:MAG: hypothetical protein NC311_03135 [Muribaculaceae bacterium]|nr:hypothetical protein [Muribaculaceae bacterium]